MAQWSDDMPKSSMVASSNPKSATAKKKQKTSSVSSQQILRGSGQKFIQAGDKQSYHAGIAQRQSVYNIVGHNLRLPRVRKTDGYRLISGRSQDRNLLPASIPIRLLYRSSPSQLSDVKTQQPHNTGMAQRQRAGLITPRSLDRNQLPVFLQFASFTEAGRHS